ncbi:unnamed protein product [Trichobilharzia regenti]|nr:unnamed protein product [Trichobilharzia regenti]
MYRRQNFDRLNPRNVLPSRHTLFIRGLPGSTDVTKVNNETNSRCSVEFFSTSEDKKRFSVAIRFKSHDIASEIHNGKTMFGYPVELTWFKDLKKARAKSNSFISHTSFQCMKNSARADGSPRASEERSTGRRSTDRRSASRSRSFTGSSSRSASRSVVSRSRSVSNARLVLILRVVVIVGLNDNSADAIN